MSDNLGPISYSSSNDEVFLGRDYGHAKNYSETTATAIDREVKEIILNAHARTEKILTEHMDKMDALAAYLIKYEKIDGNDFKLLMEGKLTADSKEAQADENKADSEENNTQDTNE